MKIRVIGREFSETATYYDWDNAKRFPRYEMVREQEWEIEAADLGEARRWLAHNHPEMYMGAGYVAENGDFCCSAVPCGEYLPGDYETIENRILYAKRIHQ